MQKDQTQKKLIINKYEKKNKRNTEINKLLFNVKNKL